MSRNFMKFINPLWSNWMYLGRAVDFSTQIILLYLGTEKQHYTQSRISVQGKKIIIWKLFSIAKVFKEPSILFNNFSTRAQSSSDKISKNIKGCILRIQSTNLNCWIFVSCTNCSYITFIIIFLIAHRVTIIGSETVGWRDDCWIQKGKWSWKKFSNNNMTTASS